MITKLFRTVFATAAVLMLAAGCSKEENPAGNESAGVVTIRAKVADITSKVAFTPAYDSNGKPGSMSLVWSEGDALRVYNHNDRSSYSDFTISQESIGKTDGVFVGKAVKAVSYDVEVINGAFDYAAQTQPSDGVTSDLKYFASESDITDLSSIEFDSISSVLAITAQMPSSAVAATIKSVDIISSSNIFNGGNNLSITLASAGDAGNDGLLHLFAALPEGSTVVPAGTSLVVHFNAPGTSHDVYTRYIELGAKTFTSNKLNTININATKSAVHAGLAASEGRIAADPYLIGDKYQMLAMHDLVVSGETRYFKMVDDVNLDGGDWEPLNLSDPYDKKIIFDGNGHTVKKFSCNGSAHDYPSFAGILNGEVRNVVFDSAMVACSGKKGGVIGGYLGHKNKGLKCSLDKVIIKNSTITSSALAGILGAQGDNLATVSNCAVIKSKVDATSARVGGMIGSVVAFEQISDCYVEDIDVKSTSYYIGGMIGQLDGNGTMSGCHSTGSVDCTLASGNYARCGGLIGMVINATVDRCYSTCDVSVTGHFAGGLIGDIQKTVNVTKCYATGNVTLPTNRAQAGCLIGIVEKNGGNLTLSDSYATGTIVSAQRWCGGLIGGTETATGGAAKVSVTNCYSTGEVNVANSGALIGCNASDQLTCSGFIGWSSLSALAGSNNAVSTDGNYLGTEGTVFEHATALGWDFTNVWNNTNPPTLK